MINLNLNKLINVLSYNIDNGIGRPNQTHCDGMVVLISEF